MAREYSRTHPGRQSWQVIRYIEGIYREIHHYFPRRISVEKREEGKGLEIKVNKPYKVIPPTDKD